MKEQEVPKVGEYYHFWDDGKTSPSRHYICRVEEVIRVKDAKKIEVSVPEWNSTRKENDYHTVSLYDQWRQQVKDHDWVYADDTDYFIRITVPEYDENDIYAVRAKDGGWFTLDIQSWWQAGTLDVDASIYNEMIEKCYEGTFSFDDYPPADEEHYIKIMKANKIQRCLCDVIRSQASFWKHSNDITSPTHLNDIEEECYAQLLVNLINDEDREELIYKLKELYWYIRKFDTE